MAFAQRNLPVLVQQTSGFVQGDPASLIATGRLPDFEKLSDAPQSQPPCSEQHQSSGFVQPEQFFAVGAAQPQLSHASQVPRRQRFSLSEPTLSLSPKSQVTPSRDAMSVTTMDTDAQGNPFAGAACRLPRIWREQAIIWFCQVESILEESRVFSDRSKYNLVIGVLDPDTLAEVSDILLNPPREDKYKELKTRILERLTDPPDRQLQKVLSEVQLEGRKPSQLFRHMRALAGNHASEDVIKAR